MKISKIVVGAALLLISLLSFSQTKTISVGSPGPGSIAFVWISPLK